MNASEIGTLAQKTSRPSPSTRHAPSAGSTSGPGRRGIALSVAIQECGGWESRMALMLPPKDPIRFAVLAVYVAGLFVLRSGSARAPTGPHAAHGARVLLVTGTWS